LQVKRGQVYGATLADFTVDRHLFAMASALFDTHSFVKRLTAAGMPAQAAPMRIGRMILAVAITATLVRLL
jgi:hypothetical protein